MASQELGRVVVATRSVSIEVVVLRKWEVRQRAEAARTVLGRAAEAARTVLGRAAAAVGVPLELYHRN